MKHYDPIVVFHAMIVRRRLLLLTQKNIVHVHVTKIEPRIQTAISCQIYRAAMRYPKDSNSASERQQLVPVQW